MQYLGMFMYLVALVGSCTAKGNDIKVYQAYQNNANIVEYKATAFPVNNSGTFGQVEGEINEIKGKFYGKLRIYSKAVKSGMKTRDKHIMNWLEADKYKFIELEIKDVPKAKKMKFIAQLKIKGEVSPIEIQGQITMENDAAIMIQADMDLDSTKYQTLGKLCQTIAGVEVTCVDNLIQLKVAFLAKVM